MSWLLDTCALSGYAKKFPASAVVTRNVQDFALYPQVFNPWVL
ncbi:MAG: hypothetical protein WA112_00675 [Rugosibacter sp.]|jgi:predicted nucleic acid-binding protein|nr:hypothetical protein [Rugosibacter sp.]